MPEEEIVLDFPIVRTNERSLVIRIEKKTLKEEYIKLIGSNPTGEWHPPYLYLYTDAPPSLDQHTVPLVCPSGSVPR